MWADGAQGPQFPASHVGAAPTGLAKATVILAVAVTFMQALRLATSGAAADALSVAAAEGRVAYQSDFTAYDSLALISLPMQIAAFVVTSCWLMAGRRFAEAVAPTYQHRRGVVWTWLGWVVPVVSLWFPFQVVDDIRRATSQRIVVSIGGWWAAWLVYVSFGRAADRASTRTTTTGTEVAASILPVMELVATAAAIVALVLWIRVVREITAAQRERVAALAAA